jgi:hypothetical protein
LLESKYEYEFEYEFEFTESNDSKGLGTDLVSIGVFFSDTNLLDVLVIFFLFLSESFK